MIVQLYDTEMTTMKL